MPKTIDFLAVIKTSEDVKLVLPPTQVKTFAAHFSQLESEIQQGTLNTYQNVTRKIDELEHFLDVHKGLKDVNRFLILLKKLKTCLDRGKDDMDLFKFIDRSAVESSVSGKLARFEDRESARKQSDVDVVESSVSGKLARYEDREAARKQSLTKEQAAKGLETDLYEIKTKIDEILSFVRAPKTYDKTADKVDKLQSVIDILVQKDNQIDQLRRTEELWRREMLQLKEDIRHLDDEAYKPSTKQPPTCSEIQQLRNAVEAERLKILLQKRNRDTARTTEIQALKDIERKIGAIWKNLPNEKKSDADKNAIMKLNEVELALTTMAKEMAKLRNKEDLWRREMLQLKEDIDHLDDGAYSFSTKKPLTCSEIQQLRDAVEKERMKHWNPVIKEAEAMKSTVDSCIAMLEESYITLSETFGYREQPMAKVGQNEMRRLTLIVQRIYDCVDYSTHRLAKEASADLTPEDSNIVDLSVPYRATKLADMYSELYDNAWTDAFEELEERAKDEQERIKFLLEILTESYHHCETLSEQQHDCIARALTDAASLSMPGMPDKGGPTNTQKADTKVLKLSTIQAEALTDILKKTAEEFIPSLQDFLEKNKDYTEWFKEKRIRTYSEECIRLCWWMQVQSPPVVIEVDFKQGAKFDSDRYREYMKSGKRIDFVVWPPLYLSAGGALLRKGVAQGK